jgi:transcriptional regulator
MYNLPHYKENDPSQVIEFIHQHPFALIAGCGADGKPVATQIPLFIEEREGVLFLTGHMMLKTDHCEAMKENQNVLCVFTGPHAYVSATWYDDPRQASTWNYMSVHIHGSIQFLGEEALVEVLKKTSLHFEQYNAQSPTVYDQLPEDYRNRLMKAIVAFEIRVERMEHVFKLSQNRNERSYDQIIEHLQQSDADARAVAGEMEKRKDSIYKS